MTLDDIKEALDRGMQFYRLRGDGGRQPAQLGSLNAVVIAILEDGGFTFETEQDLPHIAMSLQLDADGQIAMGSGVFSATVPSGSLIAVHGLKLKLLDGPEGGPEDVQVITKDNTPGLDT